VGPAVRGERVIAEDVAPGKLGHAGAAVHVATDRRLTIDRLVRARVVVLGDRVDQAGDLTLGHKAVVGRGGPGETGALGRDRWGPGAEPQSIAWKPTSQVGSPQVSAGEGPREESNTLCGRPDEVPVSAV
jgi:hypothetical protein